MSPSSSAGISTAFSKVVVMPQGAVCHSECSSTENLPARIVRSTSTSGAAERWPNSSCTS